MQRDNRVVMVIGRTDSRQRLEREAASGTRQHGLGPKAIPRCREIGDRDPSSRVHPRIPGARPLIE